MTIILLTIYSSGGPSPNILETWSTEKNSQSRVGEVFCKRKPWGFPKQFPMRSFHAIPHLSASIMETSLYAWPSVPHGATPWDMSMVTGDNCNEFWSSYCWPYFKVELQMWHGNIWWNFGLILGSINLQQLHNCLRLRKDHCIPNTNNTMTREPWKRG